MQPPNDVIALDAVTGRMFWTYSYNPSPQARPCCGRVNRGVAILGDRCSWAPSTAIWSRSTRRPESCCGTSPWAGPSRATRSRTAPLIVKDKVIIGPAGGEYGIRGFMAAFDAETGKEAWRFNTIPGPGEPGFETWTGDAWKTGGASVWVTGSYDPESEPHVLGHRQSWSRLERRQPRGRQSLQQQRVALDADTGKLKWHFQFSPHDEFDYDSVQIPVLADARGRGSRAS